jgi:hypothetical protein
VQQLPGYNKISYPLFFLASSSSAALILNRVGLSKKLHKRKKARAKNSGKPDLPAMSMKGPKGSEINGKRNEELKEPELHTMKLLKYKKIRR